MMTAWHPIPDDWGIEIQKDGNQYELTASTNSGRPMLVGKFDSFADAEDEAWQFYRGSVRAGYYDPTPYRRLRR
jgi:hypothetical protein